MSDISLDLVRSEIIDADAGGWPRVSGHFAALLERGSAWLDAEHVPPERRRIIATIDARYKGQNHEVQVELNDAAPDLRKFLVGFAGAHRREYGYEIAGRAIEVVNCRLKAIGVVDPLKPRFAGGSGRCGIKARRHVYFDLEWIESPVFDRDGLTVGACIMGPAVIDEMSSTTLVPFGWRCTVDPSGNLLMETGP
ncbi:MAG: hypothetical protein JO227_19350 [Acetobacteraceae bacterium]|nr:hypothetical protein [Acetobacteraceae bacterium]